MVGRKREEEVENPPPPREWTIRERKINTFHDTPKKAKAERISKGEGAREIFFGFSLREMMMTTTRGVEFVYTLAREVESGSWLDTFYILYS